VRAVVGLDLGTTVIKALVMGEDGRLLSHSAREAELSHPHPGWAEQSSEMWLRLARSVTSEAVRSCRAEVVALSISSQGLSWVPVDEAARPLRDAITWLDTRSTALVESISDQMRDLPSIVGKDPAPWHPLPQWLWVREHEPGVARATRGLRMAMDLVIEDLTGGAVTDPTMAAGALLMDLAEGQWSAEICRRFDIALDMLPGIRPAGSVAGEVPSAKAEEWGLPTGCAVIVGGQDQKCAAYAAGLSPGTACLSLGTSSAVTVPVEEPRWDRAVRVPCFPQLCGGWELEAPLATTGGALRWLRDLLRGVDPSLDFAAIEQAAAASPVGCRGVRFTPHLSGAQAPWWNPDARASWTGMTLAAALPDLTRAVFEGTACEIALQLDAVDPAGTRVRDVEVFGGGARSELWLSIIASVCGRELSASGNAEMAAIGACILAGISCGLFRDRDDALGRMHLPSRRVLPKDKGAYEEAVREYEAVSRLLAAR